MDQKNFIVAIVLSVLIIVGWQAVFPPAKPPVNQQQTASTQNGTPQAPTGQPGAPGAPGTQGTVQPGTPAAQPAQVVSRSEALARSPRVTFDTPELIGSIALKGARIDDVRLVKYRVTVDPKSEPVPVLSPVGGEHPYYAEFGWSPADPSIKVPGPDTLWTADQRHGRARQAGAAYLGQWPGPDLRASTSRSTNSSCSTSSRASRTRPTSRSRSIPGAWSSVTASPRPRASTSCTRAPTASSTAA